MPLGANIVELSKFIKDKHDVHEGIKNIIRAIRVFCYSLQEGERDPKQKVETSRVYSAQGDPSPT